VDIDRCSRHIHGGFALFRQRRRCGSRYPWLQRKLSCELEQGVQCLWEILWSNGCFDWCVTDWIISIPLARGYSCGEASSENLVDKLINQVLFIIQHFILRSLIVAVICVRILIVVMSPQLRFQSTLYIRHLCRKLFCSKLTIQCVRQNLDLNSYTKFI